ncbi:hypothetical protein GCM10011512_28360 [Tersicoccus solisilvae]|uniref:Polysaccharide biosynthesis protein n=1 Tax=Tersicoccus solisilvae TaxID=1882339 RepID=A0ABQ1PMP5_9MICC|nr:oligosaccharide flippase family protein [Tersicoccus solisilvae]GGC99793.1 hypothetical protein GCM10011512_28360 [Tersicoccus solisilvae]
MTVTLSVVARGCSLAIALVCGVLTARVILGDAGVEYYALYTLITALPSLISFSDLGAGAVVVNATATSDDVRHDGDVRILVTSVGRIMLCFAAVGLLVDVGLLVSGAWGSILGDAGRIPGAPECAFLALCIFCAYIPLGIWQRILLGLGKNHVIILVQLFQGPINLALVWCVVSFAGRPGYPFVALSSMVAALLIAVAGFTLVWRRTSPLLRFTVRDVFRFRSVPGVRVMDVGWPMLAQLLATPLSMTMQRYILAQYAPVNEVAVYAAAGQVFFALSGLVSAGGMALWPAFARARHRGEAVRGPYGLALVFATVTAVICAVIIVVSPWLFSFITNGRLTIPLPVLLWFSAMIVAQAALYPLGMFIMDRPGIRFQVAPVLLMAASTVVLALVLTPLWGVTGPLAANTTAVVVFQVVPFALYIHRHRDRLLVRPAAERDQPDPVKEPR